MENSLLFPYRSLRGKGCVRIVCATRVCHFERPHFPISTRHKHDFLSTPSNGLHLSNKIQGKCHIVSHKRERRRLCQKSVSELPSSLRAQPPSCPLEILECCVFSPLEHVWIDEI